MGTLLANLPPSPPHPHTPRAQLLGSNLEKTQGRLGRPLLRSFHKRLRWRCHFMQRLEDFPKLDREPINPAYGALRAGRHRDERWAAFARAEAARWAALVFNLMTLRLGPSAGL